MYFNEVSPQAENLLQDIIELKNMKSNESEYWNERFDNLGFDDEVILRSLFKELRQSDLIRVTWADNIPYMLNITNKGKTYFDMKEKYTHYEKTNVMNNTNNFFGNATGIQIQQGTINSSQNQNITENFDYEKAAGIISEIRQYDNLIDNEYKADAKVVREILSEIEKLATQKKESGKIKTLLNDLKNLSIGISGSVIASGIVSLIAAFL